jgi:hypothetical protein
MQTIQTMSHVGPDGVLNLSVPVQVANADVQITMVVETVVASPDDKDREEWQRFVAETAGSIQDPTFFRHEQGEYEIREPM